MSDTERIAAILKRPWYRHALGDDFERDLDRHRQARWRHVAVAVLTLGLIISLLGFGVDAKAGVLETALWLKLGIQAPLFAACMAAIMHRPPAPRWRGIVQGLPVLASLTVVVVLALATRAPFTDRYLTIAGLIGFAANLTLPLKLGEALALSAANLLVFVGLTIFLASSEQLSSAGDILAFMSILIVGTLEVVRRREHIEKNAYLLQCLDQKRTRALTILVDDMTRLVHIDPLTGVGNRRSFDLKFDASWQEARAHAESIALVMIDIDHFKPFNDAGGHAAGDECLRQVARAIADGSNSRLDAVARYGGEEFALIRRHISEFEARAVCRAVEALDITNPGTGTRVTVSIGVASASPGTVSLAPETLFRRADAALYEAKRRGRNTAVFEDSEGFHAPKISLVA